MKTKLALLLLVSLFFFGCQDKEKKVCGLTTVKDQKYVFDLDSVEKIEGVIKDNQFQLYDFTPVAISKYKEECGLVLGLSADLFNSKSRVEFIYDPNTNSYIQPTIAGGFDLIRNFHVDVTQPSKEIEKQIDENFKNSKTKPKTYKDLELFDIGYSVRDKARQGNK